MYTYNVPHGLRNKKIKVLKKLFAVQMRWISADEPDAHDDADLEDSGDALVPADEVDDDVAERDDDVPGAINDLGHHDAAPDAGESSGAESSMNVRSLYQICHSISLSLSLSPGLFKFMGRHFFAPPILVPSRKLWVKLVSLLHVHLHLAS